MTEKLDVFEVLNKIDDFDLKYLKELKPEQKKTLAPYLLMQWMANCKSEEQVLRLNSFLNYYVFDLGKHPDLLFRLALLSSNGKQKKYKWAKKNGRSKKYSTTISMLRKYYQCSSKTALEYIPLLSYEDVEAIAFELGEQEDTIKKLKNELL